MSRVADESRPRTHDLSRDNRAKAVCPASAGAVNQRNRRVLQSLGQPPLRETGGEYILGHRLNVTLGIGSLQHTHAAG